MKYLYINVKTKLEYVSNQNSWAIWKFTVARHLHQHLYILETVSESLLRDHLNPQFTDSIFILWLN